MNRLWIWLQEPKDLNVMISLIATGGIAVIATMAAIHVIK